MSLRFCLVLALLQSLALAEVHAADFSTQECQEIAEKYGVSPQGCPLVKAGQNWVRTPSLSHEIQENHVFFSGGGAVLDAGAKAQVLLLAQVLATQPMQNACLRLIGHSDTSGSATANRNLALKRAEAVRVELAKHIANPARVESVLTRGEDQPLQELADNSPWQRRVEIQARTCR